LPLFFGKKKTGIKKNWNKKIGIKKLEQKKNTTTTKKGKKHESTKWACTSKRRHCDFVFFAYKWGMV
jgi:hypothetical protein